MRKEKHRKKETFRRKLEQVWAKFLQKSKTAIENGSAKIESEVIGEILSRGQISSGNCKMKTWSKQTIEPVEI